MTPGVPPDPASLADRATIADLLTLYCRAMDRIDPALGQQIWHADGTADYGAEVFVGLGRDFVGFVCAQHRKALTHAHRISNLLIDVHGDRAGSESYVCCDLRLQMADGVRQITTWGRYIDRWSRRDGRWGIDHRLAIRDFGEIREVTAMTLPAIGARDRTDPSYAVLSPG